MFRNTCGVHIDTVQSGSFAHFCFTVVWELAHIDTTRHEGQVLVPSKELAQEHYAEHDGKVHVCFEH